MALSSVLSTLTNPDTAQALTKLKGQAHDVVVGNWHLGLTAFGGPPVHFQIVCDWYLDDKIQLDGRATN